MFVGFSSDVVCDCSHADGNTTLRCPDKHLWIVQQLRIFCDHRIWKICEILVSESADEEGAKDCNLWSDQTIEL